MSIIFLPGTTALGFSLWNKSSTHFADEKTEFAEFGLESGPLALEAVPVHIALQTSIRVPRLQPCPCQGPELSCWWRRRQPSSLTLAPEGMSQIGRNQSKTGRPQSLSWTNLHSCLVALSPNGDKGPLRLSSLCREGRPVAALRGPIFACVTGTLLGLVSRGRDPGFPGFGPFTPSD